MIRKKMKNASELIKIIGKQKDLLVEVDEAIRDMSKRGKEEPIFIHRSCKPLKDVEFVDQQELFMCEEGFCGL